MTVTLWILFEKNFHIRFNFFFMHMIVYCIFKNKSTDLNNRCKNLIIYIWWILLRWFQVIIIFCKNKKINKYNLNSKNNWNKLY